MIVKTVLTRMTATTVTSRFHAPLGEFDKIAMSFQRFCGRQHNYEVTRCYSGSDGENSAEKDCLRAEHEKEAAAAIAQKGRRRFGQQITLSSVFIKLKGRVFQNNYSIIGPVEHNICWENIKNGSFDKSGPNSQWVV